MTEPGKNYNVFVSEMITQASETIYIHLLPTQWLYKCLMLSDHLLNGLCVHSGVKCRTYEKHLHEYTGESQLLWFVRSSRSCQDTAASAVGWRGHFTLWNSLCATYKDKFKFQLQHYYQKDQSIGFLHFPTLTQWSRACRKSNSSSVQSSSVLDLELTRASHSSRRSFACTQCSDSSHFALIVSRGSWGARSKCL